MSQATYINPLFKEMLNKIPEESRRESELSYGIARRIHDILDRKRLSQADLAKKTGKTPAEVSRWMSGTQNFTVKTIALIESALGEKLISVNQYRKPSQVVDGYSLSPRRAALLNDGDAIQYGNALKKGKR